VIDRAARGGGDDNNDAKADKKKQIDKYLRPVMMKVC